MGEKNKRKAEEIPVEVEFDGFRKLYFLDVLIDGGAAFEFKTVESLTGRHRSQLLHYLMMADLSHGKLVNTRTEQVQHEFVNTTLRTSDRTSFEVINQDWQEIGDEPVLGWLTIPNNPQIERTGKCGRGK